MTADKPRPRPEPHRRPVGAGDEPVLPSTSRDETDEGWGDEPSRRDAEWYERERPPHHE